MKAVTTFVSRAVPRPVLLIGLNIAPQHLRCVAKMAKVYANHKFA
jgi:hypothetical protein